MAEIPSLKDFIERHVDTDYDDGCEGWSFCFTDEDHLVVGFDPEDGYNPESGGWPPFIYRIPLASVELVSPAKD